MPYLVSMILTVSAAMIIMLTRYEGDDSSGITSKLDGMKSMFSIVDNYINTYIQSGGDIEGLSVQKLFHDGILLNAKKGSSDKSSTQVLNFVPDTSLDYDSVTDLIKMQVSKLKFPNSEVEWQLIPNKDDNVQSDGTYASSDTSYVVLVNMSADSTLMSKAAFSETFVGKEYCEKMLFGTLDKKAKAYVSDPNKRNVFTSDGNKSDGYLSCTVYK